MTCVRGVRRVHEGRTHPIGLNQRKRMLVSDHSRSSFFTDLSPTPPAPQTHGQSQPPCTIAQASPPTRSLLTRLPHRCASSVLSLRPDVRDEGKGAHHVPETPEGPGVSRCSREEEDSSTDLGEYFRSLRIHTSRVISVRLLGGPSVVTGVFGRRREKRSEGGVGSP